MNTEWSTKDTDLEMAADLIRHHLQKTRNDSLQFFDVVVTKEKKMGVRFSEWVKILQAHFCQEYGDLYGRFVTNKVISTCLINGHTVH